MEVEQFMDKHRYRWWDDVALDVYNKKWIGKQRPLRATREVNVAETPKEGKIIEIVDKDTGEVVKFVAGKTKTDVQPLDEISNLAESYFKSGINPDEVLRKILELSKK